MATALTQYTFTDDQAMAGEQQWSTRDQAWPTTIKIRVFRPMAMTSCNKYVLQVSR
jgi:hypothetical protein